MLWRVAPFVAAVTVAVAAVVRWKQAPAIIPLGMLTAAALAGALYAVAQRRRVRISDETAAAIDDDAGLGGELRSAAWFAARADANPWTGLHLDRAAAHLDSIDFAQLYPVARARSGRIATFVLVAITVLVVSVFPQRSQARANAAPSPAAPAATRTVTALEAEGVPPQLPQELEDLLAAIENGTFPGRMAGSESALQRMLSQLQTLNDPKALAALARAMAADHPRAEDSAQTMKALAERAKKDAAMTPPSDIRDALDDLSKKLLDPERDTDSAGLEKSDDLQQQEGAELTGAPQSARDATAIASLGMVSLSKQEASDPNAPPGVGAGGASSLPGTGGTMADVGKALRHEVIEANEDDISGDVQTDERRKTERGNATASFTRGAAGVFDGTHASAPPPVPETRRARIQTYFTRKQ